jgi:holo-[acyl-carrier protein] synthase
MIVGIGSDLIDIRRIAKTLDRFGDRFIHRVFTEEEQRRSEARTNRVESYAKRFAAKEACSKALGSGIQMGVAWRSMGVINLPSGKPTMVLTGKSENRLNSITPEGMLPHIHLTITDDGHWAQAFVIIEAV